MKTLYKSEEAKERILELYDKKKESLNFKVDEKDINTRYGNTRVLVSGNRNKPAVVLFHGVHAGSPLTLDSISGLQDDFCFYAIDTIGQATRSSENQIDIKDDSYAIWADEVLEKLGLYEADFIGVSYGAFILQKLMKYRPSKIKKSIMVVPSGLANGDFLASLTKLTIPLIRYQKSKKDGHLKEFIKHFVAEDDSYMFEFQKAILDGLNMDYRRPQILKKNDVEHFTKPVYIIVADNDVFFPANKTITQAKKVFINLQSIHILKGCKHMPHGKHLLEIEEKIKGWLS